MLQDCQIIITVSPVLKQHPSDTSWILSGPSRVSWQQKGKTNLGLLEQETVSGSGISWAIRKSISIELSKKPKTP